MYVKRADDELVKTCLLRHMVACKEDLPSLQKLSFGSPIANMADGTDGPPVKKAKADDTLASTSALPMCPYGSKCYRKNPMHFKEFSHPSKDGVKAEDTVQIDTSKLPACPFGTSCYRKNLLHFAQYSHPVKGKVGTDKDLPDDSSGSDTDVYNSDEENDKKDDVSLLF